MTQNASRMLRLSAQSYKDCRARRRGGIRESIPTPLFPSTAPKCQVKQRPHPRPRSLHRSRVSILARPFERALRRLARALCAIRYGEGRQRKTNGVRNRFPSRNRFLHERSSERNKLRRRADGRLSAVEPERVSRQDPPALLFYSLTGTACGFGVASGVGVATVAAGVEPFLNGKSSSE